METDKNQDPKKDHHQNQNHNQTQNTPSSDTLLVLHNNSNTIGLVQNINPDGTINHTAPNQEYSNPILKINQKEDAFTQFYSDFYHQLKNPEDFTFFKITEYEAKEIAQDLQNYIDQASVKEIDQLKDYAVSIDAVQAQLDRQNKLTQFQQSKSIQPHIKEQQYRYLPEQIDWNIMSKLNLNQEKLKYLNALEPLLKGYKTPTLIPITFNQETIKTAMDVRLSLRLNDVGYLEVRIHPVRKEPDFTTKLFGHEFTQEDRHNLLETGNMGRIVNLINPMTDELTPSVISRDRLTNELIALRAEHIRLPLVLSGVTLNDEQKKTLKEGKPLFIENMISKRGTLFNAMVQFNAEKRYVEFLFNSNIKGLQLQLQHKNLQNTIKAEVPATFRGKPLHKWQIEKLKAGETSYINGLTDSKGKKYQGYISFDKNIGKFEFSFKNPKKLGEGNKNSVVKSNGHKM
ncbi:DUF3945 domain-containing protein [Chryseobacterium chendengshani]|uniref:DUF3945 domain-containing protein n=1 Tax=Chryseobacterium sp. LJ668 TaxID=2864040 RepID=UPI001C6914D9|nr:DUF3945 domain-containing protein [Chryseobacterium sp. LJ668]MBW8523838.1 DUF3945 domain-containing protein [Chryseobacterium sp. LJ668]QYK16781.1 DUF3945 domain-containing protein [Chryseobacterium sp. LJ668]